MHTKTVGGPLAVCLLASFLLAGCGSMQMPRTLSPAERMEVEAVEIPAVVGVQGWRWSEELQGILDASGLFRRVALLSALDQPPDLVATVRERCSFHRGGFIPIWTVLTLGVVPTWTRTEFGYVFAFHAPSAPDRKVVVGCGPGGYLVVGWLGTPLNALPGWTLSDPEEHPRYHHRVALEVARRGDEINALLGTQEREQD